VWWYIAIGNCEIITEFYHNMSYRLTAVEICSVYLFFSC
jgi:hypothetical protein